MLNPDETEESYPRLTDIEGISYDKRNNSFIIDIALLNPKQKEDTREKLEAHGAPETLLATVELYTAEAEEAGDTFPAETSRAAAMRKATALKAQARNAAAVKTAAAKARARELGVRS